MSVIGRLDDQVEAVLINPLKRRERNEGEEAERDAPPSSPPSNASDGERDRSAPEERREGEGATLPVWLL